MPGVTSTAPPHELDALDALASPSLNGRLPHLRAAMDGEGMREHLQRALLDGTGLAAQSCPPPKVHIDGDVCHLQYRPTVRAGSGASRQLLVLGTMFADPAAAARFERARLAPLSARWTTRPVEEPRPTGVVEPLGLVLSVYPVDGRFPTLVDLADPQRMSGVLPGAPATGVDLVRYNRTHGPVLRYRVGRDGGGAVYAKVGSAAAAGGVRHALQALARGSVSGASAPVGFPEVLGHSTELDVTFFSALPVIRADLTGAAAAVATVERAAIVAAAIHTCPVSAGRARTLTDELEGAGRAVDAIRGDAPALAARLHCSLDRVASAAGRSSPLPMTLAHGDFTPSQILLSGSGIAVLDFDGLCRAEPALDLGRFLAYLRIALVRSGERAPEGLGSRLLDRYHALGGVTTPEARVKLYEVVSLVMMAVHAWQRIKPGRVGLACDLLERLERRAA